MSLNDVLTSLRQAEAGLPPLGGIGAGGSLFSLVREARIIAERLAGYAPNPDAPVIDSPLTASGVRGEAFTYQITATTTGSPITSYAATGLPAGLTIDTTTGLISGTPTTAVTRAVTISATNAEGTGRATLRMTISAPGVGPPIPPTPTPPWDITYSFPGNRVTFQDDPTGRIPLTDWVGWDPSFSQDMNDQALYLGPSRPTSPANQVVRLFVTYTPPGTEVEVEFDGFTLGTPASNKITIWGFLAANPTPPFSPVDAIYISGNNATGNPLQLRLVKT